VYLIDAFIFKPNFTTWLEQFIGCHYQIRKMEREGLSMGGKYSFGRKTDRAGLLILK